MLEWLTSSALVSPSPHSMTSKAVRFPWDCLPAGSSVAISFVATPSSAASPPSSATCRDSCCPSSRRAACWASTKPHARGFSRASHNRAYYAARTGRCTRGADRITEGRFQGMAFERIAELKIREAMQAGEFDDLPNAGARLDFEEYFRLPAHLRMAYSVLKSADCLPEEV